MQREDLLLDLNEDLPIEERSLFSSETMKALKVTAIAVSVLATIGHIIFSHYYLHAARTLTDTIFVMVTTDLMAIPAISFILSLLVSLLPMKKRRFSKKLLPVWCWSTITLTVLFSIIVLLTQ